MYNYIKVYCHKKLDDLNSEYLFIENTKKYGFNYKTLNGTVRFDSISSTS